MYDIFLIHDLDLYEVALRGRLDGRHAASALGRSVRELRGASAVVIDLSEVTHIDPEAALSLSRAVAELADGDTAVACVVTEPTVRLMLVRAWIHLVAALRPDLASARSAARQALAA